MCWITRSSIACKSKRFFSFPFVRTGCLGQTASYLVGNAGLPPGCKVAGARATTITSVCSTFKISGAIPLLSYTPSCYGPRKLYLLCLYLFLGIKNIDWLLFITMFSTPCLWNLLSVAQYTPSWRYIFILHTCSVQISISRYWFFNFLLSLLNFCHFVDISCSASRHRYCFCCVHPRACQPTYLRCPLFCCHKYEQTPERSKRRLYLRLKLWRIAAHRFCFTLLWSRMKQFISSTTNYISAWQRGFVIVIFVKRNW